MWLDRFSQADPAAETTAVTRGGGRHAIYRPPPSARSGSCCVGGLDELHEGPRRATVLLLDLLGVLSMHAIERVP